MTCVVAGMADWKACAALTPSPLAPSSTDNTAITADHVHAKIGSPVRGEPRPAGDGQENAAGSAMEAKSWLTKVCNKIRSGGGGGGGRPRAEKCEKCGVRSVTCRPNPSFVSGRKHFLCGDCRVSSRNMKTMYHQLCRNLSLRDATWGTPTPTPTTTTTTTCTSGGDLSSPPSPSPSSGTLTGSKSLKVRPTSPESGYETATSLDSSSSSDRLSADPGTSTSSGECGRCCSPHSGLPSACSPAAGEAAAATAAATAAAASHHEEGQSCLQDSSNSGSRHVCRRSMTEVFGGAFKSERVHLQRLQQFMAQEWVQAQKQHAAVDAIPQQEEASSSSAATTKPVHAKDTTTTTTATTTTATTAATKQYDGYLEIRTPNSRSVKYVFKKPDERGSDGEVTGRCPQTGLKAGGRHERQGKRGEGVKQCYRCHKTRAVAFRAPFGHGWLCEHCMDDLV